ncbi:MAG: YbhB/YbcL family Raf kinase inhibitor-like protein [Candidatus Levybacteria bacterium]|nr:YbhB/YbcL family Raf kinase inhibitor-like protein [Candidatus Levybacteria bacterium]
MHWVVYNINPSVTEVLENSIPKGRIEGISSTGNKGWVSSCPPSGTHHYFFKLYALDTIFNLPLNTTKSDLEKAMKGHIIEKAELVGLYQRG